MKRTEIQRKTSMKRTPPKRKPAQRNPRKPKTGDWKRWNDELFSLIVRSVGECQIKGYRPPLDIEWFMTLDDVDRLMELMERQAKCGGNLQCCHIISRSYLAVRWDENNAVSGCQSCHTYFTHHPLEWQEWIAHHHGSRYFDNLRKLALTHKRPDYVETLQRLVERAEELDIDTTKFRKHLPPT